MLMDDHELRVGNCRRVLGAPVSYNQGKPRQNQNLSYHGFMIEMCVRVPLCVCVCVCVCVCE